MRRNSVMAGLGRSTVSAARKAAVISSLCAGFDWPEELRAALAGLSNLDFTDEMSVMSSVVAEMRRLPDDADTQYNGCRVIANVTTPSHGNQLIADAEDVINVLLMAARTHPTNLAISSQVLATFTHLCHKKRFADAAVSGGAIEFVLLFGRKNLNNVAEERIDPDVGACLSCLTTFCMLPAARIRVVEAGGLEFTLDAMRTYPHKAYLACAGCNVLSWIYDFGSAANNQRVLNRIWDAVRVICIALDRHHAGAAIVVDSAVRSLSVLCNSQRANNRNVYGTSTALMTLNEVRAIDAIALAFSVQTDDDVHLARCYDVLSSLLQAVNHSDRVLMDFGVVTRAVSTAFRLHPTIKLKRQGCNALSKVFYCFRNRADDSVKAHAGDAIQALFEASAVVPSGSIGPFMISLAAFVSDPDLEDIAVRAGVLESIGPERMLAENVPPVKAFYEKLQVAASRHDTTPCSFTATCKRCAHLRSEGLMCGLPSCCQRHRNGDPSKLLLRCVRCQIKYCCATHHHVDWARHSPGCTPAGA